MSEAWENWAGNVAAQPRRIVRPRDEGEIVSAVESAARAGEVVRVVGTGHSFVPIVATDGCLISLDDHAGFEDFDRDALTATVRALDTFVPLGPATAAVLVGEDDVVAAVREAVA